MAKVRGYDRIRLRRLNGRIAQREGAPGGYQMPAAWERRRAALRTSPTGVLLRKVRRMA